MTIDLKIMNEISNVQIKLAETFVTARQNSK